MTFIGVVYSNEPLFLIASFPVYYAGGLWWLAYTVVGVLVPTILGRIYFLVKNKAIEKYMCFKATKRI